jgi:anti-sigma factor RsiW
VRHRLEDYLTTSGAWCDDRAERGAATNCDEFVELVTAHLDGTLDAATERRVVEHLAECDGCAPYLEQIRDTVETLVDLPADSLSGQAPDRLLAALGDFRRP